jgi:hypothetical protein
MKNTYGQVTKREDTILPFTPGIQATGRTCSLVDGLFSIIFVLII